MPQMSGELFVCKKRGLYLASSRVRFEFSDSQATYAGAVDFSWSTELTTLPAFMNCVIVACHFKSGQEPNCRSGTNISNIFDIFCTWSGASQFATFFAILSLYSRDVSAKRYVMYFNAGLKLSLASWGTLRFSFLLPWCILELDFRGKSFD